MLFHPLDYADVRESQRATAVKHQGDFLPFCSRLRRARLHLRRRRCLLVLLLLRSCENAQRSSSASQTQNKPTAKCKIQHAVTMPMRVRCCFPGILPFLPMFARVCPLANQSYPRDKPVSSCPVPATVLPLGAEKRRPEGRLSLLK